MEYLLMNKDDKLLSFRTDADALGTTIMETASYGDRRPHGWAGIRHWVHDRNQAKHKGHFRPMLKEWGLDTPDGFLQASHALGLNDTLWVKPESSPLRWADVSLYSLNGGDDAPPETCDSVMSIAPPAATSNFLGPSRTARGNFFRRGHSGINRCNAPRSTGVSDPTP